MQMHTVGTHKTNVVHGKGDTILSVTYHKTEVVKVTRETITLDTGGWETNTTKARMNQASNEFDLRYRVFQKDFVWYVDYNDQIREFEDNIIVLGR